MGIEGKMRMKPLAINLPAPINAAQQHKCKVFAVIYNYSNIRTDIAIRDIYARDIEIYSR